MDRRPDSIIRVPVSNLRNFFKHWFKFIKPFHSLTDREMDVMAAFAYVRLILSDSIKDPDILDQVLLSGDYKRKVMEECGLSPSHFQVIISKLKRSGVIGENRINPRYLPNIKKENKNFLLLLSFEINDTIE